MDPSRSFSTELLVSIAAEAAERNWGVQWRDEPCRTYLRVTPILRRPCQEGNFGLGFGLALGGEKVICWVWEAWDGTMIDPWVDEDIPIEQELNYFHVICSLNESLPIFDRACRRYMAHARRISLSFDSSMDLSDWRDLEPLTDDLLE